MKQYVALLAGLIACNAQAWDCEYEKEIGLELDLTDSKSLTIKAQAGDLSLNGRPDVTSARVSARVCSSTEEWLEQSEVVTQEGQHAEIVSVLPRTDTGWSLTGNRYLYMDLEIEVPSDLALIINDSSGDIDVADTASVTIKDSSGDIEIEQANGAVVLRDSSGDIELRDITGDVTVEVDSSGDIYGTQIEGSVLVGKDSSGDIRFRKVEDDFTVERDSSGDIVADSVGGNFRVIRDGSGDIRASGVAGSVDIPEKG